MGDYLYHFSEDPTITRFAPRVAPTQQVEGAYVWADDDWHQFRYWFPRQCPRATWWPKDRSTRPTVAIQWDWLDACMTTTVFAYRFDPTPFRANPGGGGWITEETITPIDVAPLADLLAKHKEAGNEFRIVADLSELWNQVIAEPDIDFSGIRLRNLDPDAF